MAKQFEVYKCSLCGNVVELLHAASDNLACCGQPMNLMAEGAVDAAQEKHVPVLEADGTGSKVKVGSVTHPMEEKHWIEWIEIARKDGKRTRVMLKPGDAPEAHFCCPPSEIASVREYCNIHGLWKA